MIRPVYFKNNKLHLIDQRLLPEEEKVIEISDYHDAIEAIKNMTVRGAPAIGITGAYALVLGAQQLEAADFLLSLDKVAREIIEARPTAVNLSWAVKRLMKVYDQKKYDFFYKLLQSSGLTPKETLDEETVREIIRQKLKNQKEFGSDFKEEVVELLKKEADLIRDEDAQMCRAIGKHGAGLFKNKVNVLTHCNAGALATAEYGTALGVIRALQEEGKLGRVFADETRPLLQGARLTAYELVKDGIDTTLITDNMAAAMMAKGLIDCVVVGADRIAANGDTANKIGTYGVAILAQEHGIPFYVAAPTSTIDIETATGEDIVIEERDGEEVRQVFGIKVAPENVRVENPAFDVTPERYISGIITEKGVLKAPYKDSIKMVF